MDRLPLQFVYEDSSPDTIHRFSVGYRLSYREEVLVPYTKAPCATIGKDVDHNVKD